MDEIDNASEGPKAAREHLNIISKPENSPKAAQRVEDVARIASLRREASGPVRAIQSTPSLVRLHHTQELWSFSSKTQEDY
ncbi:hypothetical protein BGX31_006889 [Mortierella sp. GBA43]|nr:hypothetical protein BGX31_006889 [Mortierella sp. GBA43]